MLLVLPYTSTDHYTYFIPSQLFFREVDVETAYLKIEQHIKNFINEKNIDLNNDISCIDVPINNEYMPLSEFINNKEIDINIFTIEDYLDSTLDLTL